MTTLELQPVYEFPEIEILKPTETIHLDTEEKDRNGCITGAISRAAITARKVRMPIAGMRQRS